MNKNTKRILTCFVVGVLCGFAAVVFNIFVIGEPVSAKQLAYEIKEQDGSVIVYIHSTSSGMALKSFDSNIDENSIMHITCRKVPVTPFYKNGDFAVGGPIAEIDGIYLAEDLIWAKVD